MARREKTVAVVEGLREQLRDAADSLAKELIGREDQVLGGKFVELEDLAVGISRELGLQLLRNLLAEQAATADQQPHLCEQCGTPYQSAPPRKRQVTTQTGVVTWHEPTRFCRPCRRSFSPSVQVAGAGYSQRT